MEAVTTSTSSLVFVFPNDWSLTEQAAWKELAQRLSSMRQGKKVVLVTGVFDLFHEEHRNFLRRAKAAGDILIVGLESDARVQELKGADRPVQDQVTRLRQLTDFSSVDFAEILPQSFSRPEHHKVLIHLIQPAILAVSSHSPHLEKKQAILQEVGGVVKVVHEHNPLVSTTELVKRRTISQ